MTNNSLGTSCATCWIRWAAWMWLRREKTALRQWTLVEEYRPDLVFLDVQMPGLDGFAVIQRLMDRQKARKKAGDDAAALPQIVFATAYDQYAVRAFDVNAVDYLLKPFDRARVEQAVNGRRAAFREQPEDGAETKTGTMPIESQLDALLRLLKAPGGAQRTGGGNEAPGTGGGGGAKSVAAGGPDRDLLRGD